MSMPSKRTEGAYRWLRRVAGCVLALLLIGIGGTHGVLYVEGRSMEPTLYPGDAIVYSRMPSTPQQGDLVVFEHGDILVAHRVAGLMRDGSLRTRGDANESLDASPVDSTDVRGTIVAILPVGRLMAKVAALRD